jgi:hypothetical protein
MDNVKLFIAHDPAAAYDKAVNGLEFRYARNLNLKNIEVLWEGPGFSQWKSALSLRDIDGLTLEGFSGRQAHSMTETEAPAVALDGVRDAVIRNCRAQEGTETFLGFRGKDTEDVALAGNDLRHAAVAYTVEKDARSSAIQDSGGISPRKKI